MRNATRNQAGFTLVEIVVGVAIVAILMAVAIPAYASYQTRARISEGLVMATAAKTAVGIHYAESNGFPATNEQAGMPPAIESTWVRDVQIGAGGEVVVTIKHEALNAPVDQDFHLRPTAQAGSIAWSCHPPGSLSPKLLPANCRG